jgi:arylsulfatase A
MVGKNHVVEVKDLYTFPSYDSNAKDPDIKKMVKENYQKTKQAIKKSGFDYVASVYHNNPNFIGLRELAVQNLDWITEGGVNFIEQNKDRPFFLYFATTVPHGPVEAERSWNANPLITANGYLEKAPEIQPPRHTIPERLKEAGITEQGKENVLWLDDSLGALIKKLKEHDLFNNTIIFFFNDHGQNAKGTIYQGGVLDPSIIWKKGGFECGNICNVPVSNIDFAPTIFDYAGVKYQNEKFDGKSFYSVLERKNNKVHDSLYFELGFVRGVIKDNWKYIALRYTPYAQNMSLKKRKKILEEYNKDRKLRQMQVINEDPSKPFSHLEVIPGGGNAEYESTGKYTGYYDPDQLYDLEKDPAEQVNLAIDPEYHEKLKEMKDELKKYLDELPGTFSL